MFKVVRYDKVPLKQSTRATFIEHKDAIIHLAQTTVTWAQHGRHVEFVKGGIDIIDAYNNVTMAYRIEGSVEDEG